MRKAFQHYFHGRKRLGVDAMSRHGVLFTTLMIAFLLSASAVSTLALPEVDEGCSASWPGGLIIDHTCIDLELAPDEYIESAQDSLRVHYAHTSHGGQITTGLSIIESDDAFYSVSIDYSALPTEAGALCILDGNPPQDYITPDLYWQGASALALTQNTLDDNPALTISLWSWCTQVDYYSEEDVQEYLDAMNSLEVANPGITFIYMTGNAQAADSSGYNRWLRNEQIRQYCTDHDKILFDFADLDCWSNGDHSTYDYVLGDGILQIPIEHPDFNGDEVAHTTYTSCRQKGYAFWWLMAMIAGWNAPETTTATSVTSTIGTTPITTTTGQLPLTDLILYSAAAGVILLLVYVLVRRYY